MHKTTFTEDKAKQSGYLLEFGLEQLMKVHGYFLTGVKFTNRGYEWLMMVTVVDEDEVHWVAFSSGETMAGILRSFKSRMDQHSVKWKKDDYKNQGNAVG